jgi:hypothetical protein
MKAKPQTPATSATTAATAITPGEVTERSDTPWNAAIVTGSAGLYGWSCISSPEEAHLGTAQWLTAAKRLCFDSIDGHARDQWARYDPSGNPAQVTWAIRPTPWADMAPQD